MYSRVFRSLPLAHLINSSLLVLHGGLFKDSSQTLEDLNKVDRFIEIPNEGIMCDALWADPDDVQKGSLPSPRGTSHKFGSDITESFLKNNGIKKIIRSHEVKMEGYQETHEQKLVTVFSAPN